VFCEACVSDLELAEYHPVVRRRCRQNEVSKFVRSVAAFILLFVRFVFFFIAPKAKPFIKRRIELKARSILRFEFFLLEFVRWGDERWLANSLAFAIALVMVEAKDVDEAMVNFGRCVSGDEKCSRDDLKNRSLGLASTLEASMLKAWNAKPNEFTRNQEGYGYLVVPPAAPATPSDNSNDAATRR
jgi:hypothetical protein